MPISPIDGVEGRKIELLDRLEDAPHQVILRHPVRHRRRHQEHLPTINRNEVLTHTQNPPERTGRHLPFSDSHGGSGSADVAPLQRMPTDEIYSRDAFLAQSA